MPTGSHSGVAARDPLHPYRSKRDFTKTPEPTEPAPRRRATAKGRQQVLSFVIQKHDATRLHYDFRLELDGVLLSWAVPKGPSYDPKDKRMAVRTEDHPLSYGGFEGTIPEGHYGAGTVIVWDRGTWMPLGDPHAGLAQGKLAFELHGSKLEGQWELVRMKKPGQKQEAWLLFKKRDEHARAAAEYDVVSARPDSVLGEPANAGVKAGMDAGRKARRQAASKDGTTAGTKSSGKPAAARGAALPEHFSPQLATLASGLPETGDWNYEIKFDGYRILARVQGKAVKLFTRNGLDWTDRMPALAQEIAGWGLRGAWLDGEIVVLDEHGTPRFNALQNAFDRTGQAGERTRSRDIVYFLFDVPYFEGQDLRRTPLAERRELLRGLLKEKASARIRFSEDFPSDAASVLHSACRMKLEGIIAKRRDAPYESRRTDTWLKLKCVRRQEFVVAGFTERANGPGEVGSLLLGVHDEAGRLLPAGNVGTGWTPKESRALWQRLLRHEVEVTPFDAKRGRGRWTRRTGVAERWVRPVLVAEVSFAEWTPEGSIRHASFHALRSDKPAKAIVREEVGEVAISHPGRVIDAASGVTKLELARYYESVAEWMLPHLAGRPCALVRGPAGVAGQLFFQRHLGKTRIPGMKELDPELWPGHDALLEVPDAQALAGAAQMNVIEFHTWNARSKRLDRPDRLVFDLDPGKGVTWPQLQEAATLTRALLGELGLRSWLKTSGGKGLHVVVPIAARLPWDDVKGFSRAVVQHLASVLPERFVAKSGPSNRVGKVFADYLRNGLGATTAAAFSARARPGLGVSMPVDWDELPGLKGGAHWTVRNARDRLSFLREDPWAGYWHCRQTLGPAMKALGFKPLG